MILSLINRAIREQNWFAVAIEFVIGIYGEFLALIAGEVEARWGVDPSARAR